MTAGADGKTIEAAEKTLRIIAALSERGAQGTTELGHRLDISKSTVHHHLNTLHERGFVVKEDGKYRLSLRFLEFGERVRDQTAVYNVGRSEISSLAEETNQPTHLLTEERGIGVFVMTENGQGGIPADHRVGQHVHLHTLASGKAILANLPEERTADIVATRGLPERTPDTVGTAGELRSELEAIRNQGYATERDEWSEGQWSIAAPILQDGTVLGAVGITCFTDEYDPETYEAPLAEEVKKTAEVISIKFDYS